MNASFLRVLGLFLVLTCTTAVVVHAETTAAQPEGTQAPAAKGEEDSSTAQPPAEDSDSWDTHRDRSRNARHMHRDRSDSDLISIGHDSHLDAGEHAESVVSVFGSSSSDGDAIDVVSVLGNTRVSGNVRENAVAVMGNLSVDGRVEGDAVAVFGNVDLGSRAEIDGNVVSVFGTVHRDSAAIVHGGTQHVFLGDFGDASWLHAWVKECLLKGRVLAIAPGLGWLWTLAFGALAFYALVALMFRSGVERCVSTLETQPGHTALAALVAILLTPVLIILLLVTVIGIAALPFVAIVLFCASLFGKVVALAWVGHRITGARGGAAAVHPAIAVLVGGLIAMLLYLVPVIGFLTYKLLGFFGFGAVVYTLLLGQRARQAERAQRNGRAGGFSAGAGTAAAAGTVAAAGAAAASAAAHAAAPETQSIYGPPPGAARAAEPPGTATPGVGAPGTATPGVGAPGAATPGVGTPGVATPPPIPPQTLATLPRAGFWLRMAALLIDVLLVGFLLEAAGSFLGFWHHENHVHLLVLAIYGACMWKLRGSTVGGTVCDLRVVRLDGCPLEWESAIVRALGCFLSLAVCGLGFFWIAFDSGNQAWHDKIAGTVVVRVPKGTPFV